MLKQIACVTLFAIFPSLAVAENAPPVNYVPHGTDVQGLPPELFATLREGVFAFVDPLDMRVVLVDGLGKTLGASAPLHIVPNEVRANAQGLEYLDTKTNRSVLIPKDVDPSKIPVLTAQVTPAPAAAPVPVTKSKGALFLTNATGRILRVTPQSGGQLESAEIIGTDSLNRTYVQSTELMQASPIETRSYVFRYNQQGGLEGVARVPLEKMDTVPDKTVAIAPSGAATALVPTEQGLYFQGLNFTLKGKAVRAELPSASVSPATTVETTITLPGLGPLKEAPAQAAVINPIPRSEIVRRANAYLNVQWQLQDENFSDPNIENRCAKKEHKYWLRPSWLKREDIGKTLGPMPYNWGGGDTPESYVKRLQTQHALAGNVCICRDPQYDQCFTPQAAGTDCSGFISGCWGVSKLGTNSLGNVATRVKTLDKLLPGDALNKAGHHVRLFVGFDQAVFPQKRIKVLESTNKIGCEGVCSGSYDLSRLNGFVPIRFKGVRNDAKVQN